MSTSVNVKELHQFLNVANEAVKHELNIKVPMLVHGKHGIGKTEIIKQWAKENGYNCVVLHLSTQDISDLTGIPKEKVIECEATGTTSHVTNWLEPEWMAVAKKDSRPTLYFLDEMNRAPQYVLQTMLPFVLEGRLHKHRIRKQDIVVAAMNPDCAEYNVEQMDDAALLSRFFHLYFEPELSEFKKHCLDIQLHPALIDFISGEFGNKFCDGKTVIVEDSNKIKAMPDRRSFTRIGHLMNIIDQDLFSSIGPKLIAASCGDDAVQPLMHHYREQKCYTLKDVLSGAIFKINDIYNKKEKRVMETKLDKSALINEELISTLSTPENGAWERTSKTNDMKEAVDFKWNKTELNRVKKWMNAIPKDQAGSIIFETKKNLKSYYSNKDVSEDDIIYILNSLFCKIDEELFDSILQHSIKASYENTNINLEEDSEEDS